MLEDKGMRNFRECWKLTWKEEGLFRGLYRGYFAFSLAVRVI